MKFDAFLKCSKIDKPHIRIAKQIMNGSHNFPYQSRRDSLIVFCRKNNLNDTVRDALLQSWQDFIELPYAVIQNQKKVVKRI